MPDVDATEDDDNLDDIMGAIGLDTKPLTREDLFISENLTQLKIDTLRLWLRHEIATYHSLAQKGIIPCRLQISSVNKTSSYRPITVQDWGTACVDRYLCIYHLPWFMDLPGRPALDREAMVKRIVVIEAVKNTIDPPQKALTP